MGFSFFQMYKHKVSGIALRHMSGIWLHHRILNQSQSISKVFCWVIFAIFVAALVLHHIFFYFKKLISYALIFDRLWRMSSSIAVGSATCSRDIYISLSTSADSMGLPLESADWESLGLSWETQVGLWGPGAVFCWYYNTDFLSSVFQRCLVCRDFSLQIRTFLSRMSVLPI